MKIRAEKTPSGEYELYLEVDAVKLPIVYSENDLTVLEQNGVIKNRSSYMAGTLVKYDYTDQEKIETAILDAVTENKGHDND